MVIFRYLTKEVYVACITTTVVLLIIFMTTQFVHALNDAANGKITIQAVLMIMSLQIPLLLGYLLPLGLFLGIIIGLGRLYADSEMVVLFACGFSRLQLLLMVGLLSSLIILLSAWLMLSVEPKMQWYRAKVLVASATNVTLDKLQPQRFQALDWNKSTVFYANRMDERSHDAQDVIFASPLKSKVANSGWDMVLANSAHEIEPNLDERFLVFKNGYRYIVRAGDLDPKIIHFAQYWLRLTPETANVNSRIDVVPTQQLFKLAQHDAYAAAELAWRFAMPISALVLALLAVPLSESNPRSGKFAQLMPAILIYIAYANLLFMGRTWIQRGVVSPELNLWWIHGIFFIVALVWFGWQTRAWRFLARKA